MLWWDLAFTVIRTFLIFFIALNLVPGLIWMERRVLAEFQMRVGPNRVGPFGLLQPIADAVKLMMKEDITPAGVDKPIYYLAPVLALLPAVMALAVIPFGPPIGRASAICPIPYSTRWRFPVFRFTP